MNTTPEKKKKKKKKKKRRKRKKGTCCLTDFAVLANHRVKINKSEKIDKYLELAGEQKKKAVEYESDGDAKCN